MTNDQYKVKKTVHRDISNLLGDFIPLMSDDSSSFSATDQTTLSITSIVQSDMNQAWRGNLKAKSRTWITRYPQE